MRHDKKYPGSLKVRFFWPIKSDYFVLYVDEKYENALVTSSKGKYSWILSKLPYMNESKVDELKKLAEKYGIDVSKFEKVKQIWR